LVKGFSGDETLSTCEGWLVANSGRCGLLAAALLPFPSIGGPLNPDDDRGFGLRGAPHSSQYCEPSRFSVLHLSQVIIGTWRGPVGALIIPATRKLIRRKRLILARIQRARQSTFRLPLSEETLLLFGVCDLPALSSLRPAQAEALTGPHSKEGHVEPLQFFGRNLFIIETVRIFCT